MAVGLKNALLYDQAPGVAVVLQYSTLLLDAM